MVVCGNAPVHRVDVHCFGHGSESPIAYGNH